METKEMCAEIKRIMEEKGVSQYRIAQEKVASLALISDVVSARRDGVRYATIEAIANYLGYELVLKEKE